MHWSDLLAIDEIMGHEDPDDSLVQEKETGNEKQNVDESQEAGIREKNQTR